ncbi:MAG TPA: DUF167 domain-containing protein [Pyrinomonadaceae bacterium]|nr:DUF167 domain-containing protein [Pyrinomonadaceae bacterium]
MTETTAGITFNVRVVPRASRSEIAGEFEGALRVRLAAPPVDGAANRQLIKLLAQELKVPQSTVEIVAGSASKSKTVRICNVTDEARERLKVLV